MGWKIPCTTFVENIGLDIDDVPSTYFVVVVAAAASCVVASFGGVASFGVVVASFGVVVASFGTVVVAVADPSFVRLFEGLCGLTLQKGHYD